MTVFSRFGLLALAAFFGVTLSSGVRLAEAGLDDLWGGGVDPGNGFPDDGQFAPITLQEVRYRVQAQPNEVLKKAFYDFESNLERLESAGLSQLAREKRAELLEQGESYLASDPVMDQREVEKDFINFLLRTNLGLEAAVQKEGIRISAVRGDLIAKSEIPSASSWGSWSWAVGHGIMRVYRNIRGALIQSGGVSGVLSRVGVVLRRSDSVRRLHESFDPGLDLREDAWAVSAESARKFERLCKERRINLSQADESRWEVEKSLLKPVAESTYRERKVLGVGSVDFEQILLNFAIEQNPWLQDYQRAIASLPSELKPFGRYFRWLLPTLPERLGGLSRDSWPLFKKEIVRTSRGRPEAIALLQRLALEPRLLAVEDASGRHDLRLSGQLAELALDAIERREFSVGEDADSRPGTNGVVNPMRTAGTCAALF